MLSWDIYQRIPYEMLIYNLNILVTCHCFTCVKYVGMSQDCRFLKTIPCVRTTGNGAICHKSSKYYVSVSVSPSLSLSLPLSPSLSPSLSLSLPLSLPPCLYTFDTSHKFELRPTWSSSGKSIQLS